MSSGYSGNLGYQMPDNWAFDQFYTTSVGSGNGLIEIDKDSNSGRNTGVNYINLPTDDEIEEAVVSKLSDFLNALDAPAPQIPLVLRSNVTYEIPITEDVKLSYSIRQDTTLYDSESSNMTFTITNGTSYVDSVSLIDNVTMNLGLDTSNASITPIISLSTMVGTGKGKVVVTTDGTWINTSYIISTKVEVGTYYKQNVSFLYTISIKKSSFDNIAYQEALVSNASEQFLDKLESLAKGLVVGVVAVAALAACAYVIYQTGGTATGQATTAFIAVLGFLGLTEIKDDNSDDSETNNNSVT
ncbi:hypothetical protein CG709_17840 [Lachnotalea glycerini]|nr:hypothetical protein CG709_17840 [Lachnotalea glycerini]